MKGYRFVKENLKSEHGDIQWVLGEWQKCEGKLSLCKTGLHASQKPLDSLNYIFGTRWFECEARGKVFSENSDKFCASEMRLFQEIPKEVLIQFAIDCAKKVLSLFKKEYPNNKQPRIKAAELYLKKPNALTRDAARAAYDASEAVKTAYDASDAARAAYNASEAVKTAYSETARTVWTTRAACNDWVAWKDASDAMKKWQNRHLLNLIRKVKEGGGEK